MLLFRSRAAGKHHTLNKSSFLHFMFYFQMIHVFDKYNPFISNPKAILKERMSDGFIFQNSWYGYMGYFTRWRL